MYLKKIAIDKKTKFKVYNKHKVKFGEIKQALLSENKVIRKTKDGKYTAFTKTQKYLTIVFSMDKNIATIITAYPSSKWQIKSLQRRTKK